MKCGGIVAVRGVCVRALPILRGVRSFIADAGEVGVSFLVFAECHGVDFIQPLGAEAHGILELLYTSFDVFDDKQVMLRVGRN